MKKAVIVLVVGATAIAAACSESTKQETNPKSVTLMAYDSFVTTDGIFDQFTKETGIKVEVVTGGDAGELVAKASLTAGNPEADVLWGVDNTLLTRATDNQIFESYHSPLLSKLDKIAVALVPDNEVTPVDTGDVCLNIDTEWFPNHGLVPPMSLDDLIMPDYKGLTVVSSPVTSSPGLAFMLTTIAKYGEQWTEYWKSLIKNDVKIVDGWTQAYTVDFSGSSGHGDYPIVVSYGTSPPAEVLFADPPVDTPPTSVLDQTCFHQVEFAGVLRGTKKRDAARRLIDYLVSETFQNDIALNMFVYPANKTVELPEIFNKFAVIPTQPWSIPPNEIAKNEKDWLATWTEITG